MTDRTRRSVLALAGGTVVGLAGCLGDDGSSGTGTDTTTTRSPGTTDGTTTSGGTAAEAVLSFDHARELHRVDAGFPQREVGSYYLALLGRDDAAAFPTDRFENDAAARFVRETAYDSAAVVVLHDRRSSSTPDLELVGVGREGRTLTLDARYPGNGATADVTTDTLLARVPVGDGPVRAARATVEPQYGDSVRFATSNVYDTVPQFGTPGDVLLRNRDCETARVSVTLTYGGDLFYRDGVELSSASTRTAADVLTHPGEYTLRVHRGESTVTESWSLTETPPGDLLVDVDGEGTVSLAHRPDGVGNGGLDACETGQYPYESSNPDENVADPVDLWVLDHSAGEHTLSVTVSDGDTRVFADEFALRAGYDKAQRANLLAKQTTYAVAVALDGETTVSESVTVTDGVSKLMVRVAEDGTLQVLTE